MKEAICYDDDCYRKAECDKANVRTDKSNMCLEYMPEDVAEEFRSVDTVNLVIEQVLQDEGFEIDADDIEVINHTIIDTDMLG